MGGLIGFVCFLLYAIGNDAWAGGVYKAYRGYWGYYYLGVKGVLFIFFSL